MSGGILKEHKSQLEGVPHGQLRNNSSIKRFKKEGKKEGREKKRMEGETGSEGWNAKK